MSASGVTTASTSRESSGAVTGTNGGASGSTFYWPMRLLPSRRRRAAFAVYAFCRAVDDIADGTAPREERRADMAAWRRRIAAVYGGDADAAPELARAITLHHLPRDAFDAVIDGMEMDLNGPIVAPDMETLSLYCARVAGAVGRLMVLVFGHHGPGADAFALSLGEALQLTNILRDVEEDAAMGRLYLPREALDAAGIGPIDRPTEALSHPGLAVARAWVAGRAHVRFQEARGYLSRQPRGALWAAGAMMTLYRMSLLRMEARGWRLDTPNERAPSIRPHPALCAWITLRHALGFPPGM